MISCLFGCILRQPMMFCYLNLRVASLLYLSVIVLFCQCDMYMYMYDIYLEMLIINIFFQIETLICNIWNVEILHFPGLYKCKWPTSFPGDWVTYSYVFMTYIKWDQHVVEVDASPMLSNHSSSNQVRHILHIISLISSSLMRTLQPQLRQPAQQSWSITAAAVMSTKGGWPFLLDIIH